MFKEVWIIDRVSHRIHIDCWGHKNIVNWSCLQWNTSQRSCMYKYIHLTTRNTANICIHEPTYDHTWGIKDFSYTSFIFIAWYAFPIGSFRSHYQRLFLTVWPVVELLLIIYYIWPSNMVSILKQNNRFHRLNFKKAPFVITFICSVQVLSKYTLKLVFVVSQINLQY